MLITISHPPLPDHTPLDLTPDQVQRGDVVQFLIRGAGGGTRQGGRVVRISSDKLEGRDALRFDFEDAGDYFSATTTSVLRIERPQHEGALSAKRQVITAEVNRK